MKGLAPQKILPFLWFNHNAEEAVNFYISVFGKNSCILSITRYSPGSRGPEGSIMTIAFMLRGQKFVALNGGPLFKFNESVSFVVHCDTQKEVDHFWNKLSKGGDPKARRCGWLKDRFGLSWQVFPTMMIDVLCDKDPKRTGRVMQALFKMNKPNILKLKKVYKGR